MVECTARRAAGIEVWLDQSEVRGGDTWNSAIRKQIKTCALIPARYLRECKQSC
jgi:hypothetical protein